MYGPEGFARVMTMELGARHERAPESLFALFVRYRKAVCTMLRRKGIKGPAVDDLSQEVFVRALMRERVDGLWLLETARRVAANYRRLHVHIYEVQEPEPNFIENTPGPPEDRDARLGVRRTLRGLTREQRELLVRHELEGVALHELAAEMGLSKSGMHFQVEKARAQFRHDYG